MPNCRFHPDAAVQTDEVLVSVETHDDIYEGYHCSVCHEVLGVGGFLRRADSAETVRAK